MANSGVQSPLGINLLGSVLNNAGLFINSVAAGYMGASKTNSDYTPGSLVSSTVLNKLTQAINAAYGVLDDATYNNLISIGRNTIPALGNSPPPTYLPTDPANVWTTTAVAIATQHGVTPAMPCPATSGYPLSYNNTDQGQDASWFPYDTTNPNKSVTQWGYIRLHALQAWNEFNWNGTAVDQATPDYKEFCSSFITCTGIVSASNSTILSANNSDTFMQGAYSNMNDLITADIAGVCLSSVAFGNDLISQGKVIDLTKIETFGLPSSLLSTLGQNYAMTQELILALLSAGLSNEDIDSISSGTSGNVSAQTEQQIYGAFLIITGENLTNILAIMQCSLPNLTTLADLLNLKLLFPTSYSALTVPIYNANPGPTNSKTYYLIYQNGGVNSSLSAPAIQSYVGTIIPSGPPPITDTAANPQNYSALPIGFDSYLTGIIPADQAVAAGAFSYSMRQIKNIHNVNMAQFAKVAQGMETVTDLPLVAGTDKPTAQSATDYSQQVCAVGSGPSGTYTMSDFFGCMSGLPYPWQLIQQRINELATPNLYTVYENLYTAVTTSGAVQTYIDQANAEIASILSSNPETAHYLNNYWNICGAQLAREQRARYTNLPPVSVPKNHFVNQYPASLSTFVNSVSSFAADTAPHMAAQTLEAISDLNTLGGQSSVAMMRQERNQARLNLIGIEADNNVNSDLSNSQLQTVTTNGTISGARNGIPSCGTQYTNPAWFYNTMNGQTITSSPTGVYTPNVGFQSIPTTVPGDITQILNCVPTPVANPIIPAGPVANVSSPIAGIVIIKPPADYDPTNLPPNLNPNYIGSTLISSSPNVAVATQHVITCNCDCWV